ncbi:MAG: hypothetical protein U0359_37430 [Byssovorax sp.]
MRSLYLAMAAALGLALTTTQGGALAEEGRSPAPAQTAAPAQTTIACEVIILHATNDGSGIDPKIGKMPELSKPPFSSYNSYKLLDRPKISLDKGKSSTVKLPTGRDLMVTFKDVIEPKKKDEPKRYVVTASIQKPDGNTFLPLLEVNAKAGEIFFVGGQSYQGGSLVIGIKVAP